MKDKSGYVILKFFVLLLLEVFFMLLSILTVVASSVASTSDQLKSKYLEYYFVFQDAKKMEEEGDYFQAISYCKRANSLLKEIQTLDPSWRPAFINAKIREIQNTKSLMEYYITISEAKNFESSLSHDQVDEAYKKAKLILLQIKNTDPSWRHETVNSELNQIDDIIQRRKELIQKQEKSTPADEKNKRVDQITTAGLSDLMSPLPRAVSPAQTQLTDLTNTELKKVQSLLAQTKATLAALIRERDDLKQRLQSEQSIHYKEIYELSQNNDQLKRELSATKDRLLSSEQEIKRIKQNTLEETLQSLNTQLAEAKTELHNATLKIEAYEKENTLLKARIQQIEKQLAAQNPNQLDQKNREVEVLNEIITRLNSEQTRREKARQAAMAEISKLQIQSTELLKQINILSEPIDKYIQKNTSHQQITDKLITHPRIDTITHPEQQDTKKFSHSDYSTTTKNSPQKSTQPKDNSPNKLAPQENSELPESVASLADEADTLFSEGKFEEAAARYEKILESYPDSSYALANYGVICQQLGRTQTALAALERAVEIAPSDTFALNMLGVIHCILGLNNPTNYQKAYDVLTRAAQLEPENALNRNYLGIAAFNLNKPQIAERELRKAIEIRSDYSVAHINLAVIYANQSPPALEMARRHYIRAIQLGHPRHIPTEEKLNISDSDLPRTALTRAG